MPGSLEEELKAFEKELSLLLVRFMKICDEFEKGRPRAAPPEPAPVQAAVTKPATSDFVRAYN